MTPLSAVVQPALAPFAPRGWLRNPHLQSILGSSGLRRMRIRARHRALTAASREVIVDGGDGVRLQGFHAPAIGTERALIVLLHGWEGSSNSSYQLSLGARLREAGFGVFRLNFRDHGESHHLNEEMFHSARINEVVAAVRDVQARYAPTRMLVGGFSLGGNFALRVAMHAPLADIALAGVFAVCPAVHPPSVLDALEAAPSIYHDYFMRRWRASLTRKQALYPDTYRFDRDDMRAPMRRLTELLIERHTEFESLDEYLHAYSIAGDRMRGIEAPTAILAAADDPVIPVDDFRALQLSPHARLEITQHGGHCGYLQNWRMDSWAEEWVLEWLNRTLAAAPDTQTPKL